MLAIAQKRIVPRGHPCRREASIGRASNNGRPHTERQKARRRLDISKYRQRLRVGTQPMRAPSNWGERRVIENQRQILESILFYKYAVK